MAALLPRARHAADACAAELELGPGAVVVLADPRACDRRWQAVDALRQFAAKRKAKSNGLDTATHTHALAGDSKSLVEREVLDPSDRPTGSTTDDDDAVLFTVEEGNAAMAGSSQRTDSVATTATATMDGRMVHEAVGACAEVDSAQHNSRDNRLDVIADQQRLEWVADVLASVLEAWTVRVGLVDEHGQEVASSSSDHGVSGDDAHGDGDDEADHASASIEGGVGVDADDLASLRKQWRRTCRAWRSVSGASAVDYGQANDGVAMLCVVTCWLFPVCVLPSWPDDMGTLAALFFARELMIDNFWKFMF